ncbi:hypothetical protein DSO57_1000632 [Entomophthora muscae]|uniref:Uncharacterized protein n=1 Tax=Entomophthora muscae TaxID=34485 RepID=A0ACC2S0E0_9FUNG|nr:hypothetical protein DSO57_1000632 [Entomophthora muscae]
MADTYLDVAYGNDPNNAYDLYIPSSAKEPAPLLVWIHGGAWVSGHRSEFARFAEKLAADSGIATALLGYRLTPRPPTEPGQLRHPMHVQDCIEGILHLLANKSSLHYSTNIFLIGGHSAGAFIASQIALSGSTFASSRSSFNQAFRNLRGIISTEGIFDLKEFSKFDETYAPNYILPAFGEESGWKDASPQMLVPSLLSKSLRFRLIHSTQDSLVSQAQSENFKDHLLSIGFTDVKYDYLELGDHDEAPQTELVFQRVMEFINQI